MGAANVGAVLLTWHDLSHRAHRVLVAMAHLSLDNARDGAPARRYWGGTGYLAEVLYGPAGVVGRDDRGEPIPTPSAQRQVEKCLTELVRAGALRRVVKGAPGRRAEYEVVLARPEEHPTETVGQHPTETVGNTRPERSVRATDSVGPRRQRIHKEHTEENSGMSAPRTDASADDADDDGREWSDVVLVDDTASAEAYPAALGHLERRLGAELAGDRVAAYVAEHAEASYTRAVVDVAIAEGFRP